MSKYCRLLRFGLVTYLADSGEDGFVAFVVSAFILALFHVRCEVVKQVIDDLCFEHFDFILLCKLLGIWHNFDVEDQHAGKLFVNSRTCHH